MWDIYVSARMRRWLTSDCHPQDEVIAEIFSGFAFRLQKLRQVGRAYGKEKGDPIKKLASPDGLWEVRVAHPTGWYRLFFRFERLDGREVVVVGDAELKKERLLPSRRLEVADVRVRRYYAELGASRELRLRDLMR
jgi:hypothetical protein